MLDALRLETFDEGLAVQTLHIGSYDAEGPVLEDMHNRVIPSHRLMMTGKHHEIYLNDFRRPAADKLRTNLSQPVVRQSRVISTEVSDQT
ncbi:GyrI-like domain-containing protein [Salinibacterium sp.]|uniref:GyrI-like domain-containing protein n=1 Tax=Salinibacterium sp. TaxID=1915057 RepID=UPI00286B7CBF|nr:GyrI-like domain-containing protein [Salinibacterium sp.]